jgi:hypothetical protein
MAPFDLDKALRRISDREAIDRIQSRGVRLGFVRLMDARAKFLSVVRDAGEAEIVLTRRGWPVAAMLSKARWIELHQRLDDVEDVLAAYRCFDSGSQSVDLVGLLPARFRDFDRLVRGGSWKGWTPMEPRYRVLLSTETIPEFERRSGFDGDLLVQQLESLRREPQRRGSRLVEREPHVRTMQTRRYRIVWRVDGRLVTVVRVVPMTAAGARVT